MSGQRANPSELVADLKSPKPCKYQIEHRFRAYKEKRRLPMRTFTPLKRRHKALATLPLTAAVSAAISATTMLMPSVAMAQLEEVVVTARARAESLQDVPATVTAFTEGQI